MLLVTYLKMADVLFLSLKIQSHKHFNVNTFVTDFSRQSMINTKQMEMTLHNIVTLL